MDRRLAMIRLFSVWYVSVSYLWMMIDDDHRRLSTLTTIDGDLFNLSLLKQTTCYH